MSRLKIIHFRVNDINDPEIANVALGELFNDITGNVFYKHHINGNIIQVTNVSGLNTLAWSGITGKPTTISGYGITINTSDIPTLDKSKISFGTGNSLSSFGITLASTDFPTVGGLTAGTYSKVTVNNKGQVTAASTLTSADLPTISSGDINFGTGNTLSSFGITLASGDIPTLDKSKINFGTGNSLSSFGITLASGDIPTSLPSIAFTTPPTTTVDPTNDSDLTRKKWVLDRIDENVSSGLTIHDPVRVATNSNLNLASAITNIDGINLVLNDRVMVKNQTDTTQNGIYYLTAGNILLRAVDADNNGELNKNAYVFISDGLTNKASSWVVKDIVTTIGTDPIIWRQFNASSAYSFANGLDITGSTVSLAIIGGLTAGTYTKVTINTRGQVTSTSSLLAADIPTLDKSKISFGTGNSLSTFGISISSEINNYSPALKSIKDLTLTADSMLTTVNVSGTILFEQTPITAFGKSLLANNDASTLVASLNVVQDTLEVMTMTFNTPFNLGANVIREITPADNGKTIIVKNDLSTWIGATATYFDNSAFIILLDTALVFPDNFKIKIVNNLRYAVSSATTSLPEIQTNIVITSTTPIFYPKFSRNTRTTGFNTGAVDPFNNSAEILLNVANVDNNVSTNKLNINSTDEITLQYKTGVGFFVVGEILNSEITLPVARNSIVPSGMSDAFNNFNPQLFKPRFSTDGTNNTNAGAWYENTNTFGNALYKGTSSDVIYNGQFREFFTNNGVFSTSVNTSFVSTANISFYNSRFVLKQALGLSFSKGNKEYFSTLLVGDIVLNVQEWQYIYAEYEPRATIDHTTLKVTYSAPKYLSGFDAMAEAYACSNLSSIEVDGLKELEMGNLSPFRIGGALVKYHLTTRFKYLGFVAARSSSSSSLIDINPYVPGLTYTEQSPNTHRKGLFGNVVSTDISTRSLFSLDNTHVLETSIRETKSGTLYSPHLAYSFWFAVDTNELAYKDPTTGKQGILVLASDAASNSCIYLERDIQNYPDDYVPISDNYQLSKLQFRIKVTNNAANTASYIAVSNTFDLLPMKYVNVIVELHHNNPVKIYVNGNKLTLSTNINLTRPGSIPDTNIPYIKFTKFFYNRFAEFSSFYKNTTAGLWFSDYKVYDLSHDAQYSLDQDINVFTKNGAATGTTMAQFIFREAKSHIFNIDTKEWIGHNLNPVNANMKIFLARTVAAWQTLNKVSLPTPTSWPSPVSRDYTGGGSPLKAYSPTGRETHNLMVKYMAGGTNVIRFNINILGKIKWKCYAVNPQHGHRVELTQGLGGIVSFLEFQTHDCSEQAIELTLSGYLPDNTQLGPNDLLPFMPINIYSSTGFRVDRAFQVILEVERDY